MAHVRRLTVIVLDMLEEGSEKKTIEDREKRLLASTASKLLRFWRTTEREAAANRALARPETDDSTRSSE